MRDFAFLLSTLCQRPLLLHPTALGGFFRALNAGESPNGVPLTKTQHASKTPKTTTATRKTPDAVKTTMDKTTMDSRIAVIPVHGLLVHHESPWESLMPVTSYATLERQLTQAVADSSVDHLVLDINSPGGEVSGLFALCETLYQFSAEKTITAWVNECAFSAAYALASATSQILVNPTAGVGSIGVITAHIDQSGWDAKQGLHYTLIGAGDHKTDGNAHLPLSEEAKAVYQKEVNYLYDVFISHVARYRVISPAFIRDTQAACFWGQAAIDRQLADRLLPFSMGIREALRDNPLNPQTHLLKMNQSRKTKPTHASKEAFMSLPNKKIPNEENEENKIQEINEKQPTNSEKMAVTLADRQSDRDDVLALCQLCQQVKRMDKLAEFIAQDIRLEAAKDILLNELTETLHQSQSSNAIQCGSKPVDMSYAAQKATTKVLAQTGENPLWSLAKARSRQSLR